MKITRAIVFLLMLGGIGVPFAFAQSTLILGQSQGGAVQTTHLDGTGSWVFNVGNNLTGSTTDVQVAVDHATSSSGSFDVVTLQYDAFTSSAYSVATGDQCGWRYTDVSGAPLTSGFYDLPTIVADVGTYGCIFNPTYFYQVTIHTGTGASNNESIALAGSNTQYFNPVSNNTDLVSPAFGIAANAVPFVPSDENVGVATSSVATFCNSSFSTSSNILTAGTNDLADGFCNAFAFVFVPNANAVSQFSNLNLVFENKFPISWIGNLRTILEGATATTSSNFINLTLNFGTTTQPLGISSVNVISTTTISTYLSDSNRNLMLTLEGAVFWLAAGSFIYRELQRMWNTPVA